MRGWLRVAIQTGGGVDDPAACGVGAAVAAGGVGYVQIIFL